MTSGSPTPTPIHSHGYTRMTSGSPTPTPTPIHSHGYTRSGTYGKSFLAKLGIIDNPRQLSAESFGRRGHVILDGEVGNSTDSHHLAHCPESVQDGDGVFVQLWVGEGTEATMYQTGNGGEVRALADSI
jgi:hypothetical protein